VRDTVWPGFLADREQEWDEAYARWAAVLPRCATRMEVHDVMSEMFAELGCSHACAYLPPPPPAVADAAATLRPGSLGADLVWDQTAGGYRVQSIVHGDAWSTSRGGPLATPGVGVQVGDVVLAINHAKLSPAHPPAVALQYLGGQEVMLTVRSVVALDKALARLSLAQEEAKKAKGKAASSSKGKGGNNNHGGRGGKGGKGWNGREDGKRAGQAAEAAAAAAERAREGRNVRVRALRTDIDARYRDMVAARRAHVHRASSGRVGYLQVPDMERMGFSEFHRHWAVERARGALLVDLRGNAGGHISELLLPRLAQPSLGFELTGRSPAVRFPDAAPAELVVLLVDEATCSDGEICAAAFRSMRLGPIVGMRTWGGVAGISSVRLPSTPQPPI
jgi:hypothetical protein